MNVIVNTSFFLHSFSVIVNELVLIFVNNFFFYLNQNTKNYVNVDLFFVCNSREFPVEHFHFIFSSYNLRNSNIINKRNSNSNLFINTFFFSIVYPLYNHFIIKTNIIIAYNAEVRQEAVQQALAALKNRPKPSLPMPSKRSSVLNRSPDRDRDDSG